MTNFIRKFVNDESGASAAEYALILVVIGLAIVVAATTLSKSIGNAMDRTATCLDKGSSGSCHN
jgi:pilus assembly protein Flp/PilA